MKFGKLGFNFWVVVDVIGQKDGLALILGDDVDISVQSIFDSMIKVL